MLNVFIIIKDAMLGCAQNVELCQRCIDVGDVKNEVNRVEFNDSIE